MDGKPIKKRVRPYPIEGVLETNAVKKSVQIVYLAQSGLMATLKDQFVHVGEHHHIAFELPVSKQFVYTPVRVLKTYDKVIDPKEHKVERMAEFHFQKLTEEHKAHIVAFIKAIRQK